VARRSILLVAIAVELLTLACGARPVSTADCRPTAPVRQGSLMVLRADPSESTIRAVLPEAGTAAASRRYAVRWLVDARKAGGQLRFQAVREGTSQVYRQEFAGTGASGQLAEFPAELVFPASGCWDADVFTGTAVGSLTFRVA
jgi:hypothetical protein